MKSFMKIVLLLALTAGTQLHAAEEGLAVKTDALEQKQIACNAQLKEERNNDPLFAFAENEVVRAERKYESLNQDRQEYKAVFLGKSEEGFLVESRRLLHSLIPGMAMSNLLENERYAAMYKNVLGRMDPYQRYDFLNMILRGDGLKSRTPESLKETDSEQQWNSFVEIKAERKSRYLATIEAVRSKMGISRDIVDIAIKDSEATLLWRWICEPYVTQNTPQETHELQSEIKKLIHEISRLKTLQHPSFIKVTTLTEEEIERKWNEFKTNDKRWFFATHRLAPRLEPYRDPFKKRLLEIYEGEVLPLEKKRAEVEARVKQLRQKIYDANPDLGKLSEKLIISDKKAELFDSYYSLATEIEIPRKIKDEYYALTRSQALAELFENIEVRGWYEYIMKNHPSVSVVKKGMEEKLCGRLPTFSRNIEKMLEVYFEEIESKKMLHKNKRIEIEMKFGISTNTSTMKYEQIKNNEERALLRSYLHRNSTTDEIIVLNKEIENGRINTLNNKLRGLR